MAAKGIAMQAWGLVDSTDISVYAYEDHDINTHNDIRTYH